jgi:chromosomal replication initiator protein
MENHVILGDAMFFTKPAKRIIIEVSNETGVPMSYILGLSRVAHVVAARHLSMYRIRMELNYSYPAIGRIFKRDHSTVHHAVRKWGKPKCH